MTSLIHINDNNILIQQGDSWARSLGYAWLKGKDVFFDLSLDNNAVLNCRLEPQQINSRYWQQCSQTALPENEVGMRHSADLVWKHLVTMKDKYQLDEVSFVVPSHYQADNLSLLLGVAKAAGLQVRGLINKAVYCLHSQGLSEGKQIHIDVQLHQTVCSEVNVEANKLSLGKVEVLHEVGLHNAQDALLRAIQERFIAGDRFDPLHYAETEQQLFDQLNNYSEQIARKSKADMIIEYGGKKHGCSIDNKQWQKALSSPVKTLSEIAKETSASRFIDFNGFHGMSSSLPNLSSISIKDTPEVPKSEFEITSQGDQLIYCTSLNYKPLPKGRTVDSNAVASNAAPLAQLENQGAETPIIGNSDSIHLLQNGVAFPIDKVYVTFQDGQIVLSNSQSSNLEELLTGGELFVLSDKSKAKLEKNDRLASELADGVIMVIAVMSAEGEG